EFDIWKDATEIRVGVSYIANAGWRKKGNAKQKIYYCRRSGSHKARGTGKRRTKRQGSCKIGSYCSSTIELYLKDDCIEVKFFEDHSGHTLDLEDFKHTRLPMSTKNLVADRLSQKVPKNDILEEVRIFSGLSRSTYITNKDISNVGK
ncbi:unnamed protein product, partial [Meganyctiphanes norvegica]